MNGLIERLDIAAEGWWSWMAPAAWQSTAVGLALLALVWFGRRWPAPLRYAILVVALAKFVVPPMVAAPTGVFTHAGRFLAARDARPEPPSAGRPLPAFPAVAFDPAVEYPGIVSPYELPEVEQLSTAPEAAASLRPPATEPVASRRTTEVEHERDRTESGVTGSARADAPLTSADARQSNHPAAAGPSMAVVGLPTWKALLMLVHALGTLALLAWMLRQWCALRRLTRTARDVTAGLLHERLSELCRRLDMTRPVRLQVSRAVSSPLAFGVLRPTVVLPEWIDERLPGEDADVILAHELAHLRRGDAWMNWLQALLCAAWWFHPVAWLVGGALRRVREDCCDDVLLVSGVTTQSAYCDTLLRAAERACCRRTPGMALGMAEGLHPLGDRLKR
ncbi:MAG TPA: M56 family metallopeptidase, partial [Planctomycetaceae bacterium]|nr:M56 family metallopeptidase [Planctomycetaceae bacterium]